MVYNWFSVMLIYIITRTLIIQIIHEIFHDDDVHIVNYFMYDRSYVNQNINMYCYDL